MSVHNLDALFRPASVAVVGASRRPDRVGAVMLRNLLAGGFAGPILPVDPRYESIGGVVAYPSPTSLPVVPELAVLCTPASTIPPLIAELAGLGTRAACWPTTG